MRKKDRLIVDGQALELHIENLLIYGIQAKLIDREDYLVVRNGLFEFFRVSCPISDRAVYRRGPYVDIGDVLPGVIECGVKIGLCGEDKYSREQFGAKVMGFLMPRQSEVNSRFYELYDEEPQMATDYLFDLSKKSGYIRRDRSERWTTSTGFGEFQISINLSKPEKDPRQIVEEKNKSYKGMYPKCLICPHMAGYAGKPGFPNRQNHRIVRLKNLGGPRRDWFLQYSPYQYYNEHCIVIYENHLPMKIDKRTFVTLFDFVEMFPHYFVGSNADLPIVGGSLLSHEHYQGGRHTFPIEQASSAASFENGLGLQIDIINWPVSTIRIVGEKREAICEAACMIFEAWKTHSDLRGNIVSHTDLELIEEVAVGASVKAGSVVGVDIDEEGVSELINDINSPGGAPKGRGRPKLPRLPVVVERRRVSHNTITPILRRRGKLYEMDISLRNNMVNEEHPLGVFHPHEDVWHIKKENIGLIEVMGLAILPPRLHEEKRQITDILCGRLNCRANGFYEEHPELNKHFRWIEALTHKHGNGNSHDRAEEIVRNEIGRKFERALWDTGVFKASEEGIGRFCDFVENIGWRCIKRGG